MSLFVPSRLRAFAFATLCVVFSSWSQGQTLRNERYSLTLRPDHSIEVKAAELPPRTLRPTFTVMYSDKDPGYHRNHYNYRLAPRTAVRWPHFSDDLKTLNQWLSSADVKDALGYSAEVTADAKGQRTWVWRDKAGKVMQKFSGPYAMGTINPFSAGEAVNFVATGARASGTSIVWTFVPAKVGTLSAELTLPAGKADPVLKWRFTCAADNWVSVLFTGAAAEKSADVQIVAQECFGRNARQANFVCPEADLKLPRAHLATKDVNSALVVDPRESPFRLVDRTNSRYGLMIERKDGLLRPIAVAPMMGGPESRQKRGAALEFTVRYVLLGGDWKDTYRYVARSIYDFRDQRDNSGPGSLNRTLENIIDYLIDRNGQNYALWDPQQKYYDYWTDKSGVYKPFSPLFGLGAAVVTDDERLYRTRALPAVEFALSRKTNVFAPYDAFDNGQAQSADRAMGGPYLSTPQLVSLDAFFAGRNFAVTHLARASQSPKPSMIDLVARWRLSSDRKFLQDARELADSRLGRSGTFAEWLELYEATGQKPYLDNAVNEAYEAAVEYNLFPLVPNQKVTMDKGGATPVHPHSIGRHRNVWGFAPPKPFATPEQTVPAWRPALTGIISDAYRAGFWMHNHGQFLRLAALANDDFLRDLARWGMVGRFGNYAGDNRSSLSLVVERPDAVEHPMWELNYSTINPGHAWDFAGQVIDFLVSDCFHRSGRAIDFPSASTQGANFSVKTYGHAPGKFYDESGVSLWLPRRLLEIDNKQIDYLAGFGNGKLYLALWSQSFQTETVNVKISSEWVVLDGSRRAKVWTGNAPAAAETVGQTLSFTLPPKGIIAFAIENADVKTKLLARRLDPASPKLGKNSFVQTKAPFGPLTAMLLSMGKGLTNAFIYTDAFPENVIEARLKYRQGNGEWKQLSDGIYPYEFSVEFDESAGPMELAFEIENAQGAVQAAPTVKLMP